MKIAVLVKQVPDTEAKIRLKSDLSGIEEADIKWVINPYDEYAVEEALRLKEKVQGSEVVIVTLGNARSAEAMRQAFAMGADRGIRIDGTGVQLDIYCTALAISKIVSEEGFDIIFAGKQAVDDDSSSIVQYLAEILNLPHASPIESFELQEGGRTATVFRPVAGSMKEVIEISLPCVLGCEKGLNQPRYASLPNIMKAKTKQIVERKASELVGSEHLRVKIAGWSLPPERAAGKKIEGEPEAVAEALVKFLKEEAKII